jgi:hypothetical protein
MKKKLSWNSQSGLANYHAAAYQGDLTTLKKSLRSKKIINTELHGYSLLHQAISGGHLECVKMLLDAGHDINKTSTNMITPIQLAAIEGHLEILEYLILRGGSIHATNMIGFGPLHWAAVRGHGHCIPILLQHGLSLYAPSRHSEYSPVDLAYRMVGPHSVVTKVIQSRISVHVSIMKKWLLDVFAQIDSRLPLELIWHILSFLMAPHQLYIFRQLDPTLSTVNISSLELQSLYRSPSLSVLFSSWVPML